MRWGLHGARAGCSHLCSSPRHTQTTLGPVSRIFCRRAVCEPRSPAPAHSRLRLCARHRTWARHVTPAAIFLPGSRARVPARAEGAGLGPGSRVREGGAGHFGPLGLSPGVGRGLAVSEATPGRRPRGFRARPHSQRAEPAPAQLLPAGAPGAWGSRGGRAAGLPGLRALPERRPGFAPRGALRTRLHLQQAGKGRKPPSSALFSRHTRPIKALVWKRSPTP
ncbi:hypothetical protein P7K49_004391 [Saguinus oedipus]|uniref:Uncharacterized protein n=1 Tax=Saguinus oedipus TaxID=9490 RepID=A0ABQ9W7N7_SAGOE|nr:hypothetical protein P7K49_004391 [Saguinus oedipus]